MELDFVGKIKIFWCIKMEQYNQYYSDVVVNGKIMNDKIFKGSQIYNKNLNFNNVL